jgi:alginate O-acetyltransferase complex protein AlgI
VNYTNNEFILFFIITFIVYYTARNLRLQLIILIIASLIFYSWESPQLLTVFILSWFITGLTSFLTSEAVIQKNRLKAKIYTIAGVCINLTLLGFFKYKTLFINEISTHTSNSPQTLGDWLITAPLPIGISFYTFHGISLLVDIYRGTSNVFIERRIGITKHLTETLAYLSFFPQLIAGPIIKAKDFYPQVHFKKISEIDFIGSARIMILGYFLKSVIADNLSELTFWIQFPYIQWKSSSDILLLLYGYSAQIFADFAGYSLIAIGLGKLLGYELPRNFNFPYLSDSISEFWRRWHISLSNWLRDYLYFPLGGSKKGERRTYINLLIVMFLGGLWHGAALSFAVWGLWHGIALAIERPFLNSIFLASANPTVKFIRIFFVFNFVTIGWLFFKLQDFSQAIACIVAIFNNHAGGFSIITKKLSFLILIYGSPVLFYHLSHAYKNHISIPLKDMALGMMLFFIITNPGPPAPFVYFQF